MATLAEAPSNLKIPEIMQFLKDAEIAWLSEEEQFKYERSLRVYRDNLLIKKSMKLDKKEVLESS